MKKSFITTALVIMASFLLAACTQSPNDQQLPTNPAVDSETTENVDQVVTEPINEQGLSDQTSMPTELPNETEPVDYSQPQTEIALDMMNFTYSQTELVVPAGEEITLNLNSEEGFHDFVVDELNVDSPELSGGEMETITFTAGEEHIGNTYEFYCSVGNHRQQGMVGTITIVE